MGPAEPGMPQTVVVARAVVASRTAGAPRGRPDAGLDKTRMPVASPQGTGMEYPNPRVVPVGPRRHGLLLVVDPRRAPAAATVAPCPTAAATAIDGRGRRRRPMLWERERQRQRERGRRRRL